MELRDVGTSIAVLKTVRIGKKTTTDSCFALSDAERKNVGLQWLVPTSGDYV